MTDEPDLIPQPHGGALRPFTPARGAAARRTPMRAVKKEALALLASATPEAAERLLVLMRSEDERVSSVACVQILDRVLGKASEQPQAVEDSKMLNIDHLSPPDRLRLSDALGTFHELVGLGPGRLPDA